MKKTFCSFYCAGCRAFELQEVRKPYLCSTHGGVKVDYSTMKKVELATELVRRNIGGKFRTKAEMIAALTA